MHHNKLLENSLENKDFGFTWEYFVEKKDMLDYNDANISEQVK